MRFLPLWGLMLWFLGDASAVRQAAQEALQLCGTTVIPALLPFFVVSDLLLSLGFGQRSLPGSAALMELYHLPGQAASAWLLGLVGGYPVGARTAAQLYRQGQLTRQEAEQLLTFCSNANPVFFISVVGIGVFGSFRVGLWLWLIHLLSALLTGLLCRRKFDARSTGSPVFSPDETAFLPALAGALGRGSKAMLSVCACVIFFYVLLTPVRPLTGLLPDIVTGLTELFSLQPRLTADLPGLVLASGCGGWGGLSVLAQSAAVLDGLSSRPLLQGKAVQGLLSALLAALLGPLILC